MNWVFLAIMTAVFYGMYNVFIKVASGHINEIVGAVILQLVAALLGAGILLVLKITNSPLEVTQKGVFFAILAGIFVGLAEITSFYVFSKGVPTSVGLPIIIGGSIVVGTLIGVIFLREHLVLLDYLAVGLIIAGVIILSAK